MRFITSLVILLSWSVLIAPVLGQGCLIEEHSQIGDGFVDASDLLGQSVAIDGERLVASKSTTVEEVLVLRRAGCAWVLEDTLADAMLDDFGVASVAIDGIWVVVGTGDDAISIWEFVTGAWSASQTITDSGSGLGAAVGIASDWIAAAAAVDDTVQVFEFSGSAWPATADQTLTATGATGSFGESLDIHGDLLIVGDRQWGGSSAGRAFVYRVTSGTWSLEATLVSSDIATADLFGSSVAIFDGSVERAIVGATGENSSDGAAYVFEKSGGSWVQTEKLIASDDMTNGSGGEQFGEDVDLADGWAVVGSRFSNASGFQAGAGYVFAYDGSDWNEEALLIPSDAENGLIFGREVAISEDAVLISGISSDTFEENGGALYFYPGLGDCDGDMTFDICELATDPAGEDADCNGILDVCQCFGDVNGSGTITSADSSLIFNDIFFAGSYMERSDLDCDGDVDQDDLDCFTDEYGMSPNVNCDNVTHPICGCS